jgi:hypothetical protein
VTLLDPARPGLDLRSRLSDIALFGHAAKLLAKDVGLLAAMLGDDPGFAVLRSAAEPFLERIART